MREGRGARREPVRVRAAENPAAGSAGIGRSLFGVGRLEIRAGRGVGPG